MKIQLFIQTIADSNVVYLKKVKTIYENNLYYSTIIITKSTNEIKIIYNFKHVLFPGFF